MSGLPWFKLHADIVDSAKLRLIAFEDRWHFVALCALKCDGILDDGAPHRERRIAIKLGVQLRELEEIKRRLVEVDLIDANFHPVGWAKRQSHKKSLPEGEELDGAYRGYVYFIAAKGGKTVKIGYSKNPWARVKDFQSAHTEKLVVVATVKTTDNSEVRLHSLFAEERLEGEWFRISPRLKAVIDACARKSVKTDGDVVDYVATTKDIEEEREEEEEVISPNGDCASDDALKPEHVVSKWNEIAPLIARPSIRDLTPSRRQLVKARIAQYSIDDFVTVFGKVQSSAFLRGDLRWSGATFDWIMKKANFQKIIEGNYDG